MKMVAAANCAGAGCHLEFESICLPHYAILLSLAQREGVDHPLLVERPEKKIKLVILAGDRGCADRFNANIFKKGSVSLKAKEAEGIQVVVRLHWQKGLRFFKKRAGNCAIHEGLLGKATFRIPARWRKRSSKTFRRRI